jgi:Ni,Fe-hydrogenase III large subunit
VDLAFVSAELSVFLKDFDVLIKILHSNGTFMDRVEGTGILKKKIAEDSGVTGPAGRASGINRDLRSDFETIYHEAGFILQKEDSGDVLARLNVRINEFKESARVINEFIGKIPAGPVISTPEQTTAGGFALGYSEAWRGPVLYWLALDGSGLITRCKVTDPSVRNWQGLAFAAPGNIIPDFPLCNKSFNLSYPGNDL